MTNELIQVLLAHASRVTIIDLSADGTTAAPPSGPPDRSDTAHPGASFTLKETGSTLGPCTRCSTVITSGDLPGPGAEAGSTHVAQSETRTAADSSEPTPVPYPSDQEGSSSGDEASAADHPAPEGQPPSAATQAQDPSDSDDDGGSGVPPSPAPGRPGWDCDTPKAREEMAQHLAGIAAGKCHPRKSLAAFARQAQSDGVDQSRVSAVITRATEIIDARRGEMEAPSVTSRGRWLTPREAARRLRIPTRMIRELLASDSGRRHLGDPIFVGGVWRIPEAACCPDRRSQHLAALPADDPVDDGYHSGREDSPPVSGGSPDVPRSRNVGGVEVRVPITVSVSRCGDLCTAVGHPVASANGLTPGEGPARGRTPDRATGVRRKAGHARTR